MRKRPSIGDGGHRLSNGHLAFPCSLVAPQKVTGRKQFRFWQIPAGEPGWCPGPGRRPLQPKRFTVRNFSDTGTLLPAGAKGSSSWGESVLDVPVGDLQSLVNSGGVNAWRRSGCHGRIRVRRNRIGGRVSARNRRCPPYRCHPVRHGENGGARHENRSLPGLCDQGPVHLAGIPAQQGPSAMRPLRRKRRLSRYSRSRPELPTAPGGSRRHGEHRRPGHARRPADSGPDRPAGGARRQAGGPGHARHAGYDHGELPAA